MMRTSAFLCICLTALEAAPDRLLGTIDSAGLAPEDIARDSSDGSYWVTSYLERAVFHYDASWKLLGSIPSPFFSSTPMTGVAFNSAKGTLFLINPLTAEIVEVDRTGTLTGTWLRLELDPVVNPRGQPFVRALAYVPASDFLDETILVYESVGAKIYGFLLDGTRLFSFVHPDDPDGYPGHGSGVSGGGILPILDDRGVLVGVEIGGRRGNEYAIRRVDLTPGLQAVYGGRYVPLTGLSGMAAGFERGQATDPANGEEIEAYYVAVDTQHKIFIFRTDALAIYEPFETTCAEEGDAVTFAWKNAGDYDRIVLIRDGAERATLPGSATSFRDEAVSHGTHDYELWAEKGADRTRSFSCRATIGPGQVLARTELPGESAGGFTIGHDGLLWIADPRGLAVLRYDLAAGSFEEPIALPLEPPLDEPFWPARIACDLTGKRTYVFESEKGVIYTFDETFNQVAEPATVVLSDDPEAKLYVSCLVYWPAGDGGKGSLLLLEAEAARIFEITRQGTVLRSFRHPDWFVEQPPEGSPFGPAVFGLALPPGGAGATLDVTGGSLWDRDATRILRVAAADGEPSGYEIPLAGAKRYASPFGTVPLWVGSRLFLLNLFELTGVLYELRTDVSSPPPPTDLVCRQISLDDTIAISFRNNGPYERIAVTRNDAVLAELPGDATGYEDAGVPHGVARYAIIAYAGGKALRPPTCTRLVGPGAPIAHKVLWPPAGVEAAGQDPTDGSYFMASAAYDERTTIYHLDREGSLLGEFPSPYEGSWRIGAITASPRGAGRYVTTIGWNVGASLSDYYPLLLTHQSETGAILAGPREFTPPILPRAPYIIYPASLHWDRGNGFWYLERNAQIMWHIDFDASPIAHFPHPVPPTEQFVFALATSFVPERGVFYLSTDSPGAFDITRFVECTLDGFLTGHEIPLDATELTSLKVAFIEGAALRAFGSREGMPAIVNCKAFDVGPTVTNLTAALEDRRPRLAWEVAGPADRVTVERDGVAIAELPGGARSHLDAGAAEKTRPVYVVRASAGGVAGPHAAIAVFVPPPESDFVRGDSNRVGGINIADAIFVLSYLFSNGPEPPCLDAADADDDGGIRINDAIFVLQYLFANGPEPHPPFPGAGFDTTEDLLSCRP